MTFSDKGCNPIGRGRFTVTLEGPRSIAQGTIAPTRERTVKIPVGVAHPVPAYRQGLVTALLGAGFGAEAVEEPALWAQGANHGVLLVSVSLPDESPRLARLRAMNEDLRIIALLRSAGLDAYREAFRFGAAAALGWDETPEEVVRVVGASLDGFCLLPVAIARGLASADGRDETSFFSEWERTCLRRLAAGATVADVAKEANYSEREMFRLLHHLYERLGARSRIEALVKAARLGLLDDLESEA